MRVLGIDPGTVSLGYGVVDEDGLSFRMVNCGVLRFSPSAAIEERLCSIYERLREIVLRFAPEEVAVEEPFVAENVRTALAIGRAQAVALLAASMNKVPVHRYSPAQVKQRITNYGGSDKRQMQQMVKMQLGLLAPPQPDDAADALAVAICHLQEVRVRRLMADRAGIVKRRKGEGRGPA
jgi:crossover junction endodeoxyribonuclease RuvC